MAECESVDVLEALLERDETYPPWGLQLRGGTDFRQPLTIARVTPRSPAARIGLKAGDMITEIGDQPTSNLTQQEALDTLAQYGLSLILTVERKARGSIPTNPVLHGPANAEPIKGYQTYNMASGNQRPVNQHDYRFETVKARPFEVPPTKSVPSAYTNPPPVYQSQQVDYDQLDSPGAQTQSRTFKILQGLMENEVEPPPCALTPGYTPVAGNHDDQPPAPSIVHKQYNTPMTLYSQKNISETVKIDGMSLNDKDGDDDEPKSYLSSSVMQMVKEMDEEDNRVKTGKPTKYNALGHRKPDGRGVENPFSQASMSYKAYARKFAPFGGSTAIEDERELQEKREREEQRASQSDFYSSNQSVEPTNGADDFVAQSGEFNSYVGNDTPTPCGT